MSVKVSVIIPFYNYGSTLSEALDSVIEQTFEKWEAIVIDDGSNDNTKDIVETYVAKDNRIRYIYQDNLGVAAAINNGVKNA